MLAGIARSVGRDGEATITAGQLLELARLPEGDPVFAWGRPPGWLVPVAAGPRWLDSARESRSPRQPWVTVGIESL